MTLLCDLLPLPLSNKTNHPVVGGPLIRGAIVGAGNHAARLALT